ncbi:MAG: DNA translocase FtsK [Candidatus Thorarchaeota archaeon]
MQPIKQEEVRQAVKIFLEHGYPGQSILQRKMKRASQLVNAVEKLGIIGPFRGAKAREMLITNEMICKGLVNGWSSPEQQGEGPGGKLTDSLQDLLSGDPSLPVMRSPTSFLRWAKYGGGRVLEQKWINSDGSEVWKAIPEVITET